MQAQPPIQTVNMPGSSPALLISEQACKQPVIVIAPDAVSAQALKSELKDWLYLKENVALYPDYEVLAYDKMPIHPDIVSERVRILAQLNSMQSGVVICTLSSILHLTTSVNELLTRTFNLAVGENLNIELLRQRLVDAGYYAVSKVQNRGEFVTRGGIVDIFPMGAATPYRIDLFDDEVTDIRTFDITSQLSTAKIDKIAMQSAHEFPFDNDARLLFRKRWRELFSADSQKSPVYKAVKAGTLISGLEFYLPLFVKATASWFDYLPANTQIITIGELEKDLESISSEIKHRYRQLGCDSGNPILEPKDLFLDPQQLKNKLQDFDVIKIDNQACNPNTILPLQDDIKIEFHARHPAERLINFLQGTKLRVCIALDKAGRIERLLELLKDEKINIQRIQSWSDFLESDYKLGLIEAPVRSGFVLSNTNTALIASSDLFGASTISTYTRKSKDPLIDLLHNLDDIDLGSVLIHRDHGICIYNGLTTITTNTVAAEYVELLFADDAKVFTPVLRLNLLSRYVGVENPPLNHLRSKGWSAAKEKARKKVYDVAAELLEIYAKRELQTAQRIGELGEEYHAFAAGFPFNETEDQLKAIADIIADLQSEHKMERLICGDVGFGKTEIAMRAAFLMVDNDFQVAVLAPTTLLVEQHFKNFSDRFANWPIKIKSLSRFNSAKVNKENKAQLKAGTIDIIVGTHAILSKDVDFKNLGMLILDEEHRFGVRQKEKIKDLRSNVDVLNMSATPIPRTLNLSLSGVTDISIIGTPPAKRLAVRTSIIKPEKHIIREAIMREIMRGGQVYVIHNDVATIQDYADKIAEHVPEAKVRVAHAQMRERELENIMSDFFEQQFNILVCTTIVESGIDNPIANTIIIDKAQKFGLAQLHQLRGRVGRSHHQSYAYLLVHDEESLTKAARQRLEAICQYSDLGAGFNLASVDLEIRGAGEILGQEQSGQITEIGYGMYLDMLSEAVANLKAGKKNLQSTEKNYELDMDLPLSCLLPSNWIKDIPMRLQLYQELNSCKDFTAVEEFRTTLLDRFGAAPIEAFNLLESKKLSIRAQDLGIKSLRASKSHLTIKLGINNKLDLKKIISLIQRKPQQFRLADAVTLSCRHDQDVLAIMPWINQLLSELT